MASKRKAERQETAKRASVTLYGTLHAIDTETGLVAASLDPPQGWLARWTEAELTRTSADRYGPAFGRERGNQYVQEEPLYRQPRSFSERSTVQSGMIWDPQ